MRKDDGVGKKEQGRRLASGQDSHHARGPFELGENLLHNIFLLVHAVLRTPERPRLHNPTFAQSPSRTRFTSPRAACGYSQCLSPQDLHICSLAPSRHSKHSSLSKGAATPHCPKILIRIFKTPSVGVQDPKPISSPTSSQ